MGANALNRSLQPKAVIMVLLMMLMLVPLTPVSTAEDTNPDNLQAQHIAATFDSVSETTTVTWQNIDTFNGNTLITRCDVLRTPSHRTHHTIEH